MFNANKKNKENLKNINEYIERLEDIKTSNEYGEWTFLEKDFSFFFNFYIYYSRKRGQKLCLLSNY